VAGISAKAVKELREKTGAGMMDCKRALADADGDAAKAGELLRERGLAKAVKREGRETSEGAVGMALAGDAAGLVELGCETDFVAKTDDFQALAAALAAAVAADPGIDSPEALLATKIDGETVEEKVKAAIGKLGENIVAKRVARVSGSRVGGYVHAGGKLGVVVALETGSSGEPVEALAKDLAMHVAAADPSPVAVDRDGVPEDLVAKEAEIFRKQAEQEGKPAGVVEKIVEGRVRKYYNEVCLLEQPFVKDPDKSIRELLADAEKALGGGVRVAGFVRFRLGEAAAE
jgi:elongation factor Ts